MKTKLTKITCIIFIVIIVGVSYLHYIPSVKAISPIEEGGIRVISYNLKYASWDKNEWYPRRDAIVSQLEEYQADLIGVQEANEHWMSMEEGLPYFLEEYSYVGVGRDDGNDEGEYAAIFYRTDRFEVLEQGNFWLSETPSQPSYGWDASNKRICTWVTLLDLETGKSFTHYNTHLDHQGDIARQESVKLLVDVMMENEHPIILTGDFNFLEKSKEYKKLLAAGMVKDSKYQAVSSMAHGTINWYSKYNVALIPPIDFCFTSSSKIKVQQYRVDNSYRMNGVPVSDHFPVIVDLFIL